MNARHASALWLRALSALFFALVSHGCIQRPVGNDQPKTTNVIVGELRQNAVDKIDMLFVIDNSISMADKQRFLALAVPDLVERLVDPVCVDIVDATNTQPINGADCPEGFKREFQPIDDIHVGIITSSLGDFGAVGDCDEAADGDTDNAHLLGSLPRGGATSPGFLSWCTGEAALKGSCVPTAESESVQGFNDTFRAQVELAGDTGCGWEATLEAWYRFLIEPYPWTNVVRQNCPFGEDQALSCVGPETDPLSGAILRDNTVLEQRKQFLRPDSLVAIIMLTDENDCSFKATGQSWRLSQTRTPDGEDTRPNRAYKGTTTCATAPNDPCCHSCGGTPPAGCLTTTDENGKIIGLGCEEPRYASEQELFASGEPSFDAVNLRCFNQKQRFGVDYLYPTARYSNALLETEICPFADNLLPDAVDANGNRICGEADIVKNPLYDDLTLADRLLANPQAEIILSRNRDLVFLAGIVGVPWQDLALDPEADTLVYRSNRPSGDADQDAANVIDWRLLLGSEQVGAAYDLLNSPPSDPLMYEQVEPRADPRPEINGGEWNIADRGDLQYACTFPLSEPRTCPPRDQVNGAGDCDCTYYGDDLYDNPLCNGLEQVAAKAYPSIRPLQVLRDYGPNSIVASICPKNITDDSALDFGYRPAVAAIVDRLKEQLKDKCLPRKLEVQESGKVSCVIVEADPNATGCDSARARAEVTESVAREIFKRLERTGNCEDPADCQRFNLCGIVPLPPDSPEHATCLLTDDPPGDGWCYVDPEQGLGELSQVEKCGPTEQRKIRFAGAGKPSKGTITFFACAGAPARSATTPSTPTPAPTPSANPSTEM